MGERESVGYSVTTDIKCTDFRYDIFFLNTLIFWLSRYYKISKFYLRLTVIVVNQKKQVIELLQN